MSMIQITEAEVADKLPGLLSRVQDGDQVVIETGSCPIVVERKREDEGWTASEALQRLAGRTLAVVDSGFAKDLAEVRREVNASYEPAEWD